MKVILCQTVKSLGERGDVILVSDGYARNYLIPRRLAWEADEKNIRRLKEEKRKEVFLEVWKPGKKKGRMIRWSP